jgi:Tol biopolymer transport system component
MSTMGWWDGVPNRWPTTGLALALAACGSKSDAAIDAGATMTEEVADAGTAVDGPLPDLDFTNVDVSAATHRILFSVTVAQNRSDLALAYLDSTNVVGVVPSLTGRLVRLPGCGASPNGQRVVSPSTDLKQLAVAPLDPATSTLGTVINHAFTTNVELDYYIADVWSPDSRWLIYASDTETSVYNELRLVDVQNGYVPALVSTVPVDRAPVWFADSTRFTFVKTLEIDDGDVFVAAADPLQVRSLRGPSDPPQVYYEPTPAPFGSKMFFFTSCRYPSACATWSPNAQSPTTSLWIVDAATNDAPQRAHAQLSPGQRVSAAAWSSNGSRLAYALGTDLYVIDVSGSGPWSPVLLATASELIARLRWSPDGTWIAFSAGTFFAAGSLHLIRADGLDIPRLLSSSFDASSSYFEFSPASNYLTFEAGQTLRATRIAGGTLGATTTISATMAYGRWSPNGMRYMYQEESNGTYDAHLVEMSGTTPGAATLVGITANTTLWSPDSQHILVWGKPNWATSTPYRISLIGNVVGTPQPLDPQLRQVGCATWLP